MTLAGDCPERDLTGEQTLHQHYSGSRTDAAF